MRSRRVARQEKLAKGTLRKRKHRESEESEEEQNKKIETEDNDLPKTVSIDDGLGGTKCRIRINVDSVSLDSIDLEFRKANCVYPRAMEINTLSPFASQRQLEEAKCNELAWKLAWLNPKQLANRKSLLQRVLDVYRSKFLPELNPRKNSLRMSGPTGLSIDTDMGDVSSCTPLTVAALAAQEKELPVLSFPIADHEDTESLYSGTTDSLDFHDCFSPHADTPPASTSTSSTTTTTSAIDCPSTPTKHSPTHVSHLMLSVPSTDDLLFNQHPTSILDSIHPYSSRHSISSSSTNSSSSPCNQHVDMDDSLFKDNTIFELYTDHQFPTVGHFDQYDYIKAEDDLLTDPLISQLFHL